MIDVRYAVLGAGVSGLAFANFVGSRDVLVLERDAEPGGYCKTITRDGFVWDYSGHFFHFRHADIDAWLRERMPGQEILTVQKSSKILYKDQYIDFPFQKNIHQLPRQDLLDCLHDLHFRPRLTGPPRSFEEMLISRFGASICEKFLFPYNEKLYACPLNALDPDAMGRFFPDADVDAIIANFRAADNASYNATFTYPRGGAIQYIHALLAGLAPEAVRLGDPVVSIDLPRRTLTTRSGLVVRYERLISSAPFDRLLELAGLAVPEGVFTSNKVHVFNLGFDRKGPADLHWLYVPARELVFYRVGFYDNIFGDDRMSLYIEIGRRTDEPIDEPALLDQTMRDLRAAGIVTDHALVAWHSVTLDPAYVHVRREARAIFTQKTRLLHAAGVYPIGRYGGWTYCSIEDNIVEARDLARLFNDLDGLPGGAP